MITSHVLYLLTFLTPPALSGIVLALPMLCSQNQAIWQDPVQLQQLVAQLLDYLFNHQISIEYYYVYSPGQPAMNQTPYH